MSAAGYPFPIEESPVLGVREILVRIRGSYGSGYGRPTSDVKKYLFLKLDYGGFEV
jgi:hypothetical protein